MVYIRLKVEDDVGDQAKTEHIADPGWVGATNLSTSDDGVDIPVDEYDKSSPKCRNDVFLKSIGEIRCVG